MLAIMSHENPTPLPLARSRLESDAFAQHWHALAAEQEDEDVYLCELAGVEQLSEATSLQAVINTTTSTVSHLGAKLPNLIELNLSNSVIESIRDLGSGFRQLQVLWVSRCGLVSLDGIAAMDSLRELYCAYNDISDLLPLTTCNQLEVLDLEGNCLAALDSLDHLAPSASTLQSLTLLGNPLRAAGDASGANGGQGGGVQRRTRPDVIEYILQLIPGLQTIDDMSVEEALRGGAMQEEEEEEELGGWRMGDEVTAIEPGEASGSVGTGAVGAGTVLGSGEMDLVLQGIKHARVGMDSHEFKEVEGNLLLASAGLSMFTSTTLFPASPTQQSVNGASHPHPTAQHQPHTWREPGSGSDRPSSSSLQHHPQPQQAWGEEDMGCSGIGRCSLPQGDGRMAGPQAILDDSQRPLSASALQPPVTASMSFMPVTVSAWLRTLRSSTTGALANLRMSREGSLQGQLSVTPPCGDGSASGGPSPITSRPESATHNRDSHGSGGAAAARPSTALVLQHSASLNSNRPSTTAGIPRPFTGRPGSAMAGAGLPPGSAAAAPGAHAAGGLYWRKHRIQAAAAVAWGAEAGMDEEDGAADGGGAGSSTLTYGGAGIGSIGGSLARDLRRRRKAAGMGPGMSMSAVHPSTAPAGTSIIAGVAAATARRQPGSAGPAPGSGLASRSGRGGSTGGDGIARAPSSTLYDAGQLLEELRRWKLDTADRALADEEGVAMGGAGWGAPGAGAAGGTADTADILDLTGGTDNVSASAPGPGGTSDMVGAGAGLDVLSLSDDMHQAAGGAMTRDELVAGILEPSTSVKVDAASMAAAPLRDPRIQWMSNQRSVLSKVVRDVGLQKTNGSGGSGGTARMRPHTVSGGERGASHSSNHNHKVVGAGKDAARAAVGAGAVRQLQPSSSQKLRGEVGPGQQGEGRRVTCGVSCVSGEVDLAYVNPQPRQTACASNGTDLNGEDV